MPETSERRVASLVDDGVSAIREPKAEISSLISIKPVKRVLVASPSTLLSPLPLTLLRLRTRELSRGPGDVCPPESLRFALQVQRPRLSSRLTLIFHREVLIEVCSRR